MLQDFLAVCHIDMKVHVPYVGRMTAFQKDEIVAYYVDCEKNYRHWWDLDRSMAMHAGFWDANTLTLHQALLNENKVLAEIAGIRASDRVLDAGCGVGGSSIFLAQHYHCSVVGITLAEQQVQRANAYAAQKNLVHPPEFLVRDYTQTNFPDASFDVVWAIESVCHAENKRDFVQEAWRVLKPNGRLILADGFQTRSQYSDSEKRILDKAVNGWAVDTMESITNFEQHLVDTGFRQIAKKDATPLILPSSRRLHFYSYPAIAWSKLGEIFGWSSAAQTRDFIGYHYQYKTVKKGLAKYIIFSAIK